MPRIPRLVAFLAFALVLPAAVSACSGDGGGDDKTDASPTVSDGAPRPTEILEPTVPAPPGTPPLVYDAVVTKDAIELAGLTFYQQLECERGASDTSDAPPCRDTDDEGQKVDVFPLTMCERRWVRPELVPDAYRGAIGDGDITLFAAYRPKDDAFAYNTTIDSVLVMRTGESSGFLIAIEPGGRIVTLEAACNGDFAALYAPDRVEEFIIEPQQ